jgi:hypothetical protein
MTKLGPSLMGLRGTQITGSISYTLVTWCPSDMPGVPRELIEHALNVDPKARPVKQPL